MKEEVGKILQLRQRRSLKRPMLTTRKKEKKGGQREGKPKGNAQNLKATQSDSSSLEDSKFEYIAGMTFKTIQYGIDDPEITPSKESNSEANFVLHIQYGK